MKPLTLLLSLSLAGNAALLAVFAFRPALAPPALRDWFVSDAQRAADATAAAKSTEAKTAAQARTAAAKKAGVWASLQTDDLKSLVARLRAAGFTPAVIRAIVMAKVDAIFSSRMADLAGLVDIPYWKGDAFSSQSNPKYYEARMQAYRDRTKMLRELLGDDYFAGNLDITAEQRRRFGDLSKSKVDLVQRIVDDYAEMSSQVKAATQGITLPEDRENLALLEKEKRADLAAILSPAELEDFEMRNSPNLYRLSETATIINASAEEFAVLFRAQQPYADILFPSGPGMSVPYAQRQEAENKMKEQIKASLGPQRYAEYQRANDYEYQSLWRLGQRENVSAETINRVYDLRVPIAAESVRIFEDKNMTPEQRNAAFQALAATAKAQVIAAVGSTVADAYAQNTWLNALSRGYAIRIGDDGRTSYMTPPPPARANPTPAPTK